MQIQAETLRARQMQRLTLREKFFEIGLAEGLEEEAHLNIS